MTQLSQTPQAAQAKQLEVRRKMQGYPERPVEPINKGNWHELYLKRVAK